MKKIFIYITMCLIILSCSDKSKEKKWTILIYMAADNNLTQSAKNDINQMEAALLNQDDFNVIVQADFNSYEEDSATYRYEIYNDDDLSKINSPKQNIGEKNSGDYTELISFLNWGKKEYPAENYALFIWSHGNGWFPKNRNLFGLCLDQTSNDIISILDKEFQSALKNQNLDLLIFDACSMLNLEILDELSNSAQYVIGAETPIPTLGFPYDDCLNEWDNLSLNKDISVSLVRNFSNSLIAGGSQNPAGSNVYSFSMSAAKMDNYNNFWNALDSYTANLSIQQFKSLFLAARENTIAFNNGRDIDILDFLSYVKENTNSTELYQKTDNLIIKLNDLIIHNETNNMALSDPSGISIWFPEEIDFTDINIERYKKLEFSKNSWLDFLIQIYEN